MLVVSAGKGKKELGRVILDSAVVENKVEGIAHSAEEPSFSVTVGGNVHTFRTASRAEHKDWIRALSYAIDQDRDASFHKMMEMKHRLGFSSHDNCRNSTGRCKVMRGGSCNAKAPTIRVCPGASKSSTEPATAWRSASDGWP